jgi:predicted RNase H-like HicB family nuclease
MPCTHGKTREEAIRHGEEVIEMYRSYAVGLREKRGAAR